MKYEFKTFTFSTLMLPIFIMFGAFSSLYVLFVSYKDMNNLSLLFFAFIGLGSLVIGSYYLFEQLRFKNRINCLTITNQLLIVEGIFTNNWKVPQLEIKMNEIEEIELIDERLAPHPREELIVKMKHSTTHKLHFLNLKKNCDFSISDIAKEISQYL